MPSPNIAYANERREDREDVHHRTVATAADGRSIALLVVNISPNGLMARCDQDIAPGTELTFKLPDAPPIAAEARWSLGGRMGCEFAATIPISRYFALVAKLRG